MNPALGGLPSWMQKTLNTTTPTQPFVQPRAIASGRSAYSGVSNLYNQGAKATGEAFKMSRMAKPLTGGLGSFVLPAAAAYEMTKAGIDRDTAPAVTRTDLPQYTEDQLNNPDSNARLFTNNDTRNRATGALHYTSPFSGTLQDVKQELPSYVNKGRLPVHPNAVDPFPKALPKIDYGPATMSLGKEYVAPTTPALKPLEYDARYEDRAREDYNTRVKSIKDVMAPRNADMEAILQGALMGGRNGGIGAKQIALGMIGDISGAQNDLAQSTARELGAFNPNSLLARQLGNKNREKSFEDMYRESLPSVQAQTEAHKAQALHSKFLTENTQNKSEIQKEKIDAHARELGSKAYSDFLIKNPENQQGAMDAGMIASALAQGKEVDAGSPAVPAIPRTLGLFGGKAEVPAVRPSIKGGRVIQDASGNKMIERNGRWEKL